jgi:hypothetical protein
MEDNKNSDDSGIDDKNIIIRHGKPIGSCECQGKGSGKCKGNGWIKQLNEYVQCPKINKINLNEK